LVEWDRRGKYVYRKRDLAKVFHESGNNLDQTVKRLALKGVLIRAAQGVYIFAYSSRIGGTTIEDVAMALRRGDHIFESLESALSQWGAISQIPVGRITLMTTGGKGTFHTPYGVVEFTHTRAAPAEIRANTLERPGHPLPIATEAYALDNLRRTRRNLDMVVEEGSHA
jgi:predicted transcriptional regulator of viral defense system